MSFNVQIKAAVEPIVAICEPDFYVGDSVEYCTFNYDQIPVDHGDDSPGAIQALIQLHYFLPVGQNPLAKIKALCRAVHAAGFTYPSVENASEIDQQHHVLEFYGLNGEV